MANNKKRGRSKQNKQARRVARSSSSASGSASAARQASGGTARGGRSADAGRRRWMTVVVAVLAVLMVLSVLLPSLSSVLAGAGAGGGQSQSSGDAAQQGAGEAADGEAQGMDAVDAEYGAVVEELQGRLDSASDDAGRLAPLLNLGNSYMEWASAASAYAVDEDTQAHVRDLYGRAREAYEEYLTLNDSSDVRTRAALCQYYAGDAEGAVAALEEFTATEAGAAYGPAWAYLGMMYQATGDAEAAKRAYTEATRADADDSYGAKTYATEQLAAMQSSESAAESTDTGSQQSLESVLDNAATSGN